MNFLIDLSFDGTGYCGFQVQKNGPTVCAALQDAMQNVLGRRPDVKGCSRTDAGVHAKMYCVSFQTETSIPAKKLPLALNARLPQDIRVHAAAQVPEEFHARYAAAEKEYEYVILNGETDDPLAKGQYYRVPGDIDLDAMNQTAAHLVGTHDFLAFSSTGMSVKTTVRTLSHLAARREDCYIPGASRIVITARADGFLYNMVRILAGTLLAAGRGRMQPEAAAAILAEKRRNNIADTLPAKGLFLARVLYPAGAFGPFLAALPPDMRRMNMIKDK